MKLKDIIKNPRSQEELENEDFCIDYTYGYKGDDFWGCGLISSNETDQDEIEVNVECVDSNTFPAFIVFENDQTYNDNKNFFDKCLKDMGFVRTKNRNVIEFKQIIKVDEEDLNSNYFKNRVKEVSKILVDELFQRMENAGIKSYDYAEESFDDDEDDEDEEFINEDINESADDKTFKQKIMERSYDSLKACLLMLENYEGVEALNKIHDIIFKK